MAEQRFCGVEKGLSKAGGTPLALHSTMPPMESRALTASSTAFSTSVDPPASTRVASTETGRISLFAITPAATRPAVRRPENVPPPLWSLNPPNF